MFERFRQRREAARGVDYCESCGQVCTARCRADAHRERTRAEALLRAGTLR